jgi:glycine/D-amino acid oxidase-like deaminating enzyme
MALRFDSVPSDPALPARTDVVVVGGGIVGAATALALAQKGISVALCEKGVIGGEQSGRNWGWTRVMGRDSREIPLALESLRLWRGMNAAVGAETGFRQCGIVYLCDTKQELDAYAAWLAGAREFQLDSRLLAPHEIEAVLPGAGRPFAGALHTPSDGRAEPTMAPAAIALAARRHGATLHTWCAVRGIETTGGRVSGVVTEQGPIECTSVVLAGGAWSRLFCGNVDAVGLAAAGGVDLPTLKVLGSCFATTPMAGPPETTGGGGDFAFRKRLDGGYTIARRNAVAAELTPDSFRLFFDFLPTLRTSWRELRLRVSGRFLTEWRTPRRWALDRPSPFEQVRVLDPAPEDAVIKQARRAVAEAFPAFATAREAQRWAGLIDVTPDAVPVISAVDALPGFYLATGFSGHGFGLGPGAGKLMADIVTGDEPAVDPTPFRFSRFAGRQRAA